MPKRDKVIAVFCSDIHLSMKPPLARCGEDDWFEAMTRPLQELKALVVKDGAPIYCSGDIFHKWNSTPELINFALEHLPYLHAIPGQHDLPHHNYDMIKKSAYWTLVEAGKIYHLEPGKPDFVPGYIDVEVTGFPWGFPIKPVKRQASDMKYFQIALAHQYVWIPGHSYPGAPDNRKISKSNLKGFDMIAFGDNHKGFHTKYRGMEILNCGGLMRRKSDEIDYRPQVGVLTENGFHVHYLDTKDDMISKTVSDAQIKDDMDLSEFLQQLGDLESVPLDFREAMKQKFEKDPPAPEVRQIILEAME